MNAGTLTVSGSSAKLGTGNVTVQNTSTIVTVLSIQSGVQNAISDAATLSLAGGGTAGFADQSYANLGAGVYELVGSLSLGGVVQPVGTYGATGSGAMHIFNEYFAGSGIVAVVSLPGDFNNDGVVDTADYVTWRANVGQPAGTLLNDTVGGVIGNAQYDVWCANFGHTAGSGSGASLLGEVQTQAVPEPASIFLLLCGFASLAGVVRARSGRPV